MLWPQWLIAVPRMVSKGLANGEVVLLQSVGMGLAGFGGLWRVLGSFGELWGVLGSFEGWQTAGLRLEGAKKRMLWLKEVAAKCWRGFSTKRWHGFGKFWRVLNSFEAVAAVARGCAADGKQGLSNCQTVKAPKGKCCDA